MDKAILMIGHFATIREMNDGQTVKTRNVYQELVNEGKKIETVDTQDWKKKWYKFLKELVKKFYKSEKVILIVASKGAQVLIPLLVILKKIHKANVYYCTIGSWLDYRIQKNIVLKHCCKKLDLILVETEDLKTNLKKMGYSNVNKMYNFKNINEKKEGASENLYGHFCTFSRVMKEKGIEDAIKAINEINESREDKIFLDIYGPIDDKYNKDFSELIEKQSEYIKYKGSVEPEKSIDYLSQYYILLFPTRYIKEGLPGTLIDAYNAGVPVIASNWKSANEFVKEKETRIYI